MQNEQYLPIGNLLSELEVAEILGLNGPQVSELLHGGELAGHLTPAGWRIALADLENYIAVSRELGRRKALWEQSDIASLGLLEAWPII